MFQLFHFLQVSLALCFIATNLYGGGIYLYEISTQEVGLASAGWTARAKDPSTAFTNPAGMTRLGCKQLQGGIEPLYIHVSFDENDLTTVEGTKGNASSWIPSASLFYVMPLSEKLRFGFSSVGVFGSALEYDNDWVGRYFIDTATLQGYTAAATFAYQVTDCLSVGGGYVMTYTIFNQKSRVNDPFQLEDGKLKIKDSVIGNGFVLGGLYEFSPCTRIGVQYASKTKLNFKDVPSFKDISPQLETILEDSGLATNPVKINLAIPRLVMVGLYHDVNCSFSLMGNIGWQQWSKFGNVQILLETTDTETLTLVKKYDDGWHFAIGGEYHYSPALDFSLGFAYDTSVVSNKQRTFDFPIGKQWRIGTGVYWKPCHNWEVDLAYELSWTGDLPVDQDRGPLTGRVAGKFTDTHVHFINLGFKRWF